MQKNCQSHYRNSGSTFLRKEYILFLEWRWSMSSWNQSPFCTILGRKTKIQLVLIRNVSISDLKSIFFSDNNWTETKMKPIPYFFVVRLWRYQCSLAENIRYIIIFCYLLANDAILQQGQYISISTNTRREFIQETSISFSLFFEINTTP